MGGCSGSGSPGVGGRRTKNSTICYRVIAHDMSKQGSSKHNIVLMPLLLVPNKEQAKEEATLLGLLYLVQGLPHERTLPEPYQSTYLAAFSTAANRDSRKNHCGFKAHQDCERQQPGGTGQRSRQCRIQWEWCKARWRRKHRCQHSIGG